ncbi:MAG: SpoIVB peptidase S55 domain-containing protein, partial [Vicinamibacterales bacterium]
MRIRTVTLALALAGLCWVSLPAQQPSVSTIMPISEVKAGMVGVGRTVFEGTELKDFKVHIIGVLRNIQGPKRDLILARLEGGPLAETGVAAGMSGSPVYVNGRLIGAVGYSIGAFPKEPIAGITPIEEMKDSSQGTQRRAGVAPRIDLPITTEGLAAALRATYAQLAPFARRADGIQGIGISTVDAAQISAMLRPIATPLVMTGFEPQALDLISSMFRDAGLTAVAGSAAGGSLSPAERAA